MSGTNRHLQILHELVGLAERAEMAFINDDLMTHDKALRELIELGTILHDGLSRPAPYTPSDPSPARFGEGVP